MVRATEFVLALALPLIANAASTAPNVSALSYDSEPASAAALSQVERESVVRIPQTRAPSSRPPPPVPTATSQGFVEEEIKPSATSKFIPTSTSSSSYDYSFGVALSGFDGTITHYYVSYSNPYISGAIGVGPKDPTPTPPPTSDAQGVVCDRQHFPGLLSFLGLDLGLRLNLMLIGIDACVAL
ncbi:hypothetical protein GGI07_000493 [Coemansia sp. Benny D115]|nr:hypothetical protein GGI07_000493 [Coemansia sp. Benny D115]